MENSNIEPRPKKPKEVSRIYYIDCLRGIAIAGVILVHCGQIVDGLPAWLLSVTQYGGYGVELFFVLSALTLVTVYKDRPSNLKSFFIRRFFRIAPMFYLGAIFYCALNGTGPQLPYAPDGIHFGDIALTLTFFHGWSPSAFNSVVPGGWSISDEAMFYLLFPFLLLAITSMPRAIMATLCAAILSRLTFVELPAMLAGTRYSIYPLKVYAGFLFTTQLAAFLCGFLVYFVIDELHKRTYMARKTFVANISFLIICCLIFGIAASNNKTLTNYLLADALFIPFVVAVYASRNPFVVNRVFRYIGNVSYSIYIVHFALIKAMKTALMPLVSGASPAMQLFLVYAAIFSSSTLIATATHIWIELPGIYLGKKLSKNVVENNSLA